MVKAKAYPFNFCKIKPACKLCRVIKPPYPAVHFPSIRFASEVLMVQAENKSMSVPGTTTAFVGPTEMSRS